MAQNSEAKGARVRSYCRVRVARSGEELEFEGDGAFVREMLERFGVDRQGPTAAGGHVPQRAVEKRHDRGSDRTGGGAPAKAVSVGEFVRALGFKKHTDFVVAFGYYLEKHHGMTAFTSADINNCYYEAKLESSNSSQMIIQNIKRGYVMEAKGEKKGRRTYTLTQSGEQFISNALSTAK